MFDVGSRIKELRKIKNIQQKQVALHVGFSTAFISDIENNRKKCSIENLEKICESLDVSLKEFFDVEPKSSCSNVNLTPEQIEKLNSFIESLKS